MRMNTTCSTFWPRSLIEIAPRTRHARAEQFDGGPDWLIRLPQPSAKVIRAIVKQFENAGTDALEAKELWDTPEIKKLRGLARIA